MPHRVILSPVVWMIVDFNFMPMLSQLPGDVVGLPERQLRSARSDSQPQASAPSSGACFGFVGCFFLAGIIFTLMLAS